MRGILPAMEALIALIQTSSGVGLILLLLIQQGSDLILAPPHASLVTLCSSLRPPQHFLQPAALPARIPQSMPEQYLQFSHASCFHLYLMLQIVPLTLQLLVYLV